MISRDDLNRIPELAKEIDSEQARVDAMRAKLYSPHGFDTKEKVQTSGSQDTLADLVIDLQQQVDDKRSELVGMIQLAKELINHLKGEDRVIMLLRYVDCESWQDISEILNYSLPTLYRRRSELLDILYEK